MLSIIAGTSMVVALYSYDLSSGVPSSAVRNAPNSSISQTEKVIGFKLISNFKSDPEFTILLAASNGGSIYGYSIDGNGQCSNCGIQPSTSGAVGGRPSGSGSDKHFSQEASDIVDYIRGKNSEMGNSKFDES